MFLRNDNIFSNQNYQLIYKFNIINYYKDNNVKVVAWSPISRGRVLSNELMIDLSQKYKKSIVQIVLRWHMQKGVIPIPKSSNEK